MDDGPSHLRVDSSVIGADNHAPELLHARTIVPPFENDISHMPGFTHIVPVSVPPAPENIYVRTLLPTGHGYPVYFPTSNVSLPAEYVSQGARIGDVGRLTHNGFFSFYFNIFLPANHPFHVQGTPRNFRPLEYDESEISRLPNYFQPGTTIRSNGIRLTRTSSSPLKLAIESTESEGAILVLPDGASREDLVSSSRLDVFLQEHYLDWYQYFSHYTHASPPNGSVYIVTGVDKARSWSIATFSLSTQDYKMMGDYTDGTWFGTNIIPNDSEGGSSENENPNQCVFLRGTRISLGKFAWFENFDDPPDDEARYMVILHRPLPLLQRWFYKTNEALPESQYLSTAFHPSDIIAQIMFSQSPEAKCALVSDYIWTSTTKTSTDTDQNSTTRPIDESCIIGGTSSDFGLLSSLVFKSYNIVDDNACLYLDRNQNKNFYSKTVLSWRKFFWQRISRFVGNPTDRRAEVDAISRLLQQGVQHLRHFRTE